MSMISVDTDTLRAIVEDAVQRQFNAQVEPLRTRLLSTEASIATMRDRIETVQDVASELDAMVRGNERIGHNGLARSVNEFTKRVSEIYVYIDERVEKTALALEAVNKRFDAADKQRQSLLDQIAGGKKVAAVLVGLGLLGNVPLMLSFLRAIGWLP